MTDAASIASPGPGAKRRRLMRKTNDEQGTQGMDNMADNVRKHNHRRQMDRVIQAMERDAELTSNLAYIVETGRPPAAPRTWRARCRHLATSGT